MTNRITLAGTAWLIATALTFSISADAASDKEIAQLIAQFSDDKKAADALEKVTKIGAPAVDQLAGLALEKQDTAKRGWAISALGFIGGSKALSTLKTISEDSAESMLVRTWSYAGRVAHAKDLEELTPFVQLMNQYPALKRPVTQRVLALSSADKSGAAAEKLITVAQSNWQLQQTLVPVIISFGADPLIEVMQQAKDQNARRMAAAYLGNVAQTQGTPEVAAKVIDALRFDAGARAVPWADGPLFIPSLQYDKDSATALVAQLIRWHVWCDTHGKKAELKQLHNNLRGVGLARMAGYQSPGWNDVDTATWLKAWGAVVGKGGIEKLLAEQGQLKNGRYRKALDGMR